MTAHTDRHVILALLALQDGIIEQSQLMAAFQAWMLDRSRGVVDHLQTSGDLTIAERARLEALDEVQTDLDDGGAHQCIAGVSAGESTSDSPVLDGGPDVEATQSHVGPGSGSTCSAGDHTDNDDSDRTRGYSVGSSSSDGQRFRILRPHARGGLGAVFLALDGELNREVALKQIQDQYADDPSCRARFLIEAEITGGLEHPGIVPVYGLGHYDDGRPFYAMRFINGDTPKDAITQLHSDETLRPDPGERSMPLFKLLRRFTDICNAIDYHTAGASCTATSSRAT